MNTAAPASTELIVNRIKSLVHLWMSIWDANKGDAAPLVDLLSPEGFEIHLTSTPAPITTAAGVQAWFGAYPGMVKADNHRVDTIVIRSRDDGAHDVVIDVTCPGVAIDDKPFLVRSHHEWQVVDYGGHLPRIRSVTVRVVQSPDGT